jgi:hypothetical protein
VEGAQNFKQALARFTVALAALFDGAAAFRSSDAHGLTIKSLK